MNCFYLFELTSGQCYNVLMDRNQELTITVGTIIKIALVVVGCYLVYFFNELILVVLTAVVIASAVEPAILKLEKYKIPRVFGVLAVFSAVVGFLTLIAINMIPLLAQEGAQFVNEFPRYLQDTNLWIADQAGESNAVTDFFGYDGSVSLEKLFSDASETLGFAASGIGNLIGALFGSIINLMLIFVLAFYFASQEYGIDNFLKIVVPPKHSRYAINLWRRSQRKIGLWMQGQLLIMAMTGTFVYLGLALIGIQYPGILEYALILALIAAIAELVPVVGAFISAIPAVAIAFITGGGTAALIVGIFYLVYQQFQGNLIYPLVVNKVVGVPPLLVIIGLIVGAQLFGILGAILSVPFAAAFMEFVKDVEKEHAREIMRRKVEEDKLAEKIAEKVIEKTEEKEEVQEKEEKKENKD